MYKNKKTNQIFVVVFFFKVANYYPAGNYIGQFRENVLPPPAAALQQ
jgi:hypothetical protein